MQSSTVWNLQHAMKKERDQKHKFQITDRMTCATIRVIYVIKCEKCNLQYVVQNNKSLRQQMAKHTEASSKRWEA